MSKPREFWIVDATDNSGYHTSTVKPRPPWGSNLIHVREVVPNDRLEALSKAVEMMRTAINTLASDAPFGAGDCITREELKQETLRAVDELLGGGK